MAETYQTREGDVIDLICFDYYGAAAVNQSVAAVLEANRGLADYGPRLPAGILITLPDWVPESQSGSDELWD